MKKKLLIIAMLFVMGSSIGLNNADTVNHVTSGDGEHEWNGIIEPREEA